MVNAYREHKKSINQSIRIYSGDTLTTSCEKSFHIRKYFSYKPDRIDWYENCLFYVKLFVLSKQNCIVGQRKIILLENTSFYTYSIAYFIIPFRCDISVWRPDVTPPPWGVPGQRKKNITVIFFSIPHTTCFSENASPNT